MFFLLIEKVIFPNSAGGFQKSSWILLLKLTTKTTKNSKTKKRNISSDFSLVCGKNASTGNLVVRVSEKVFEILHFRMINICSVKMMMMMTVEN